MLKMGYAWKNAYTWKKVTLGNKQGSKNGPLFQKYVTL